MGRTFLKTKPLMNALKMRKIANRRLLSKGNIVAVLGSPEDIQNAKKNRRHYHIAEWRRDLVYYEGIEQDLKDLRKPIILTVRAVDEGGKDHGWSAGDRVRLFLEHMHLATLVDFEALHAHELVPAIRAAKRRVKIMIFSCHCLGELPVSDTNILMAISECLKYGGDIFKLVFRATKDIDVQRLLSLTLSQLSHSCFKSASMATGDLLGPFSRLLSLIFKFVLTYGSADKPVIPGQLSVAELSMFKRLLSR